METDQRKSFRILVPAGLEQAVLKVGRKKVTVRVVDSSAGGFAVASSENLTVEKGDTLLLRTSAGWHEVRVVRHESFTDGVLLGVERLSDLDDPREFESASTRWLDSVFAPFGGAATARIFALGLVSGAIIAGIVWLFLHDSQSRAESKILPPAADEVVTKLATQARKVAESIRSDAPTNAASLAPTSKPQP
jgi:hypothetical protein